MTIEEQYEALHVSRATMREIARLMASGQSSEEIAVHVNMRPIDIDRIPMKYPHEWHEEMSAAARFVCQMTVLKVMAHAQMIAAETKEPKGLAALMQAIARFLRLPFLFPNTPTKRAAPEGSAKPSSERVAPEGSGPETPTVCETTRSPKVEAQPLTAGAVPVEETLPEPEIVPLPEFTDDEVTRCVKLYKADPENYLATLEHEDPALYVKCVRYHLILRQPTPTTPRVAPKPTMTQRLKGLFKMACVWCIAWFGLGTHPPHH